MAIEKQSEGFHLHRMTAASPLLVTIRQYGYGISERAEKSAFYQVNFDNFIKVQVLIVRCGKYQVMDGM